MTVFEEDYLTIDTMTDTDEQLRLKKAILALRPVERKILLTYAENETYSRTAADFNVSVTTIRRYLDDIRIKIINNLNNVDNDTDTTTD